MHCGAEGRKAPESVINLFLILSIYFFQRKNARISEVTNLRCALRLK